MFARESLQIGRSILEIAINSDQQLRQLDLPNGHCDWSVVYRITLRAFDQHLDEQIMQNIKERIKSGDQVRVLNTFTCSVQRWILKHLERQALQDRARQQHIAALQILVDWRHAYPKEDLGRNSAAVLQRMQRSSRRSALPAPSNTSSSRRIELDNNTQGKLTFIAGLDFGALARGQSPIAPPLQDVVPIDTQPTNVQQHWQQQQQFVDNGLEQVGDSGIVGGAGGSIGQQQEQQAPVMTEEGIVARAEHMQEIAGLLTQQLQKCRIVLSQQLSNDQVDREMRKADDLVKECYNSQDLFNELQAVAMSARVRKHLTSSKELVNNAESEYEKFVQGMANGQFMKPIATQSNAVPSGDGWTPATRQRSGTPQNLSVNAPTPPAHHDTSHAPQQYGAERFPLPGHAHEPSFENEPSALPNGGPRASGGGGAMDAPSPPAAILNKVMGWDDQVHESRVELDNELMMRGSDLLDETGGAEDVDDFPGVNINQAHYVPGVALSDVSLPGEQVMQSDSKWGVQSLWRVVCRSWLMEVRLQNMEKKMASELASNVQSTSLHVNGKVSADGAGGAKDYQDADVSALKKRIETLESEVLTAQYQILEKDREMEYLRNQVEEKHELLQQAVSSQNA